MVKVATGAEVSVGFGTSVGAAVGFTGTAVGCTTSTVGSTGAVVGATVAAGAQPVKNELSNITANTTDIIDLVRILIFYSPH
jgi:uncharacterized ion transporter superfamily protein YfcC